MRILIDARLLSRGGYTGIEEYASQMINTLLVSQPDNDYCIFYNGFRKAPISDVWKNSPRAIVLNKKISNKLFDLSSRILNWPKIESFWNPEIVYSPHFNILISKAPRILTFHDLSFLRHDDFFAWKHKIWVWLQNYQRQAQQAAAIVVNSEFTKSDVVNLLKINPDKISVIYPGLREEFRKLPADDPNLLNFKLKHLIDFPFILFLGTLEPRKNISAVIRSFSLLKNDPQFKNVRLIIVGRRGWLYQDILQEARNSRYRDSIIFWGTAEQKDKLFLYNGAVAFIYPSFFEGFGFPPLEAQACGCPVIASDRTSLPETLGQSAILVNPWRIDQITAGLNTLFTKPLIRHKLITAGFKNAERFKWRAAAQSLANVFQKTLGV